MELSLVGLQNAGKTSLVNVIAVSNTKKRLKINLFCYLVVAFSSHIIIFMFCQTGGYSEDMIPTVSVLTLLLGLVVI